VPAAFVFVSLNYHWAAQVRARLKSGPWKVLPGRESKSPAALPREQARDRAALTPKLSAVARSAPP